MAKKNILIVENNLDSLELLEAILEERYNLFMTKDSTLSMDMAMKSNPSLVLLDISMPKMDGTEVLRLLRQTDGLKTTPVIAVTAHAMKGDRERFLDMGFDGYVSKPIVDENVLIDSIECALQKRGN